MIVLIATCEPERLAWLPQFVAHYRAQGVERFLLSLQIEPTLTLSEIEHARAIASDLCRALDIRSLCELHVKFDAYALRAHHDKIQATECDPCDWIVWADIDEFHDFGNDLGVLTSGWSAAGCNAARGNFIDRIARDGTLAPFDASSSIWAQYPIGCNLTEAIVGGLTMKVTVARQHVRLRHANHNPIRHQHIVWAREDVPVFHFKWDASVLARLRKRLTEDWKSRCFWWTQSEAVLNAIAANGGRIPLHTLSLVDYGDDRGPRGPASRLVVRNDALA